MNSKPPASRMNQEEQQEQEDWENHPYKSLYDEVLLPRNLRERLTRDTGAAFALPNAIGVASLESPKMESLMSTKQARNTAQESAASGAVSTLPIYEQSGSMLDPRAHEEDPTRGMRAEYQDVERIGRKSESSSTQDPRDYNKESTRGMWTEYQDVDHIGRNSNELLDGIGFRYTRKGKADDAWVEMAKQLIVYQNEHKGSTVVQRDYVDKNGRNLGRWVDDQRKRMKANRLDQDRVDLLDKIGFAWDGRKAYQDKAWMAMYERLLSYQRMHNGSTTVPQKYKKDVKLGRWVSGQRRMMRIGLLSSHRVFLLNRIGFSW